MLSQYLFLSTVRLFPSQLLHITIFASEKVKTGLNIRCKRPPSTVATAVTSQSAGISATLHGKSLINQACLAFMTPCLLLIRLLLVYLELIYLLVVYLLVVHLLLYILRLFLSQLLYITIFASEKIKTAKQKAFAAGIPAIATALRFLQAEKQKQAQI